jgi:hypothetical protein
MYAHRCSASSHTASVSVAKNVGEEPNNRWLPDQRCREVIDGDAGEQFKGHAAIVSRLSAPVRT